MEAVKPSKPSRKERELEFRLNLVLDAAEEVFADSTFAKASVEEIAGQAEISVGSLYNLFRSKEDIYRGVVSRSQNRFFTTAEERMDAARGPCDKLHAAIASFFEHFQRYSRHLHLYASATNGFQWELKSKLAEEARARQDAFSRLISDLCQQGMDEGVFKKGVPAGLMAVNVVSIPHGFLASVIENEEIDLIALLPHAQALLDRILGTDT